MDLDLNSIYCSGLSLSYLLLVTSPEFSYGEFDMRERFLRRFERCGLADSAASQHPILNPSSSLSLASSRVLFSNRYIL
jgi:hypothetical protein